MAAQLARVHGLRALRHGGSDTAAQLARVHGLRAPRHGGSDTLRTVSC